MTCRFELEFAGKPYPRSCPTCGISGKCHKEYSQIKKPEGGYVLVNCNGLDSDGTPIDNKGKPYIPEEPLVPAPEGVLSVHPGEPGHETYVPRPGYNRYDNPGFARAQEAVDAAARPNVGIKLTRVKRAMIKDIIDKYRQEYAERDLPEYSPSVEAALDNVVECIINVIDKT